MSANGPYDVAVVGAGLTGALVASTLAAEGLHVVVLEAAPTPGGAIKHLPGLVLLGTPVPVTELIDTIGEKKAYTLWELTSDNLVQLEILLDQMGVPFTKPGSLRLATESDQSEIFRSSADHLRTYGYDVSLEEGQQYEGMAALKTRDDLVFAPQELIQKLLYHENITLTFGAEVYAIKERSDGTIAVWAHDQYLWADHVVVAGGIHATRLNTQLGHVLIPMTVHTVVFDEDQEANRPLILDNGNICYLSHQEQSYLSEWHRETPGPIRRLSAVAQQLCPNAIVRERSTARIASTPDHLPIVGRMADSERVTFINGLGPFGLNLALVAAEELVALILDNEPPEMFDMNRFLID